MFLPLIDALAQTDLAELAESQIEASMGEGTSTSGGLTFSKFITLQFHRAQL